ncbi:MAG: hypothetical protein PHP26_01700, partial [Syntrophomonas sp.]|nr:hypothetical protein [Syntrophomonas sp.]
ESKLATKPEVEDQEYIAFVGLYETANKEGYLGAMLIADTHGVPGEFRCTHPVKPNPIQKPLYGHTLEYHIGVNLCGVPLIKAAQLKPRIIVVNREVLLDIRLGIEIPVSFIRRAGEAIEIRDANSNETSGRDRLDCPTGKFNPIMIYSNPRFANDQIFIREFLAQNFGHLDPLEPFERIETAIKVLGEQDKRFQ